MAFEVNQNKEPSRELRTLLNERHMIRRFHGRQVRFFGAGVKTCLVFTFQVKQTKKWHTYIHINIFLQFAHIVLFAIRTFAFFANRLYRAFCNSPISRFLQFAHITLLFGNLLISRFWQFARPNIAFFAILPYSLCNSPISCFLY